MSERTGMFLLMSPAGNVSSDCALSCSLTTEALEKGADAEADFLQQAKVYLPEDIAQRITTPETPASKARAAQNDAMGPVVTELPDDIELN